MSWEDVYFEKNLDQDEIIKALAHVFGIAEDSIIIEFGGVRWIADYPGHIKMLCGFEIIRGEFPLHLEIIPLLKELLPEESERNKTIGRLCEQLGSDALATGDHSSPYIWVLIRGEGDYQYVRLDADKLDQEDEEFEIEDELYRFSHILTLLEIDLGNLITLKDLRDRAFYEYVSWRSRNSLKQLMEQALNSLRPEAQRMYRDNILQHVIDSLDSIYSKITQSANPPS